jgi:hypothetical protein
MKTTDEQPENRWKHVPHEAKAIAMDHDGIWYWYYSRPMPNHHIRVWQSGQRFGLILPQPKPNHPWIESLEEMP